MNVDGTNTTVDRMVRRAAVLGSPIEHSLSPVLHGAAYQALDLRGWYYDKIECDEPGLPRMVDGMGSEWAGLSLTMPLKRVALTVADTVSPLAEAVGAANTLVFSPAGRGSRYAERYPVETTHHGARRGVRAVAYPLRGVSSGCRVPGGQRSRRAAAPGGRAGRIDDRPPRSGGGYADRPGHGGGGPAGLNRGPTDLLVCGL